MLGAASGPLNWRAVSAADARQRWRALREWVDWFRAEFGFDHRVVPPCWYRHRALVSLLSALRDHWLYAYDPMNTAVAAADWHRGLIAMEQRMREWASRTGCTIAEHRCDVLAVWPNDDAGWDLHVSADVVARQARETNRGQRRADDGSDD